MKRKFILLNLIVVFALAARRLRGDLSPRRSRLRAADRSSSASCADNSPRRSGRTKRAPAPCNIAFSIPGLQFPFFVFMETQVKDEAEKLGIDIQTLDGQNQVPKQTADVEAAIAKKVSGILISPITADGMAPAVKEAVDAGIPVVTVDRTVTTSTRWRTSAPTTSWAASSRARRCSSCSPRAPPSSS